MMLVCSMSIATAPTHHRCACRVLRTMRQMTTSDTLTSRSTGMARSKPKHEESRTQTQAHQPKSYELYDYLFKYVIEENCVICNEGMNDVNEKLSYMTVYMRTISGKKISFRCDRRQGITGISRAKWRERQRSQKALQHLSNQGKTQRKEDYPRK